MDRETNEVATQAHEVVLAPKKRSVIGQRLIYVLIIGVSYKFVGVLPSAFALYAHSEVSKRMGQFMGCGAAISTAVVIWALGIWLYVIFKGHDAARFIFAAGFGLSF